jgi:hypothetical protein
MSVDGCDIELPKLGEEPDVESSMGAAAAIV